MGAAFRDAGISSEEHKKTEGEPKLPLCNRLLKQVVQAYFSKVMERVAVNSPASMR